MIKKEKKKITFLREKKFLNPQQNVLSLIEMPLLNWNKQKKVNQQKNKHIHKIKNRIDEKLITKLKDLIKNNFQTIFYDNLDKTKIIKIKRKKIYYLNYTFSKILRATTPHKIETEAKKIWHYFNKNLNYYLKKKYSWKKPFEFLFVWENQPKRRNIFIPSPNILIEKLPWFGKNHHKFINKWFDLKLFNKNNIKWFYSGGFCPRLKCKKHHNSTEMFCCDKKFFLKNINKTIFKVCGFKIKKTELTSKRNKEIGCIWCWRKIQIFFGNIMKNYSRFNKSNPWLISGFQGSIKEIENNNQLETTKISKYFSKFYINKLSSYFTKQGKILFSCCKKLYTTSRNFIKPEIVYYVNDLLKNNKMSKTFKDKLKNKIGWKKMLINNKEIQKQRFIENKIFLFNKNKKAKKQTRKKYTINIITFFDYLDITRKKSVYAILKSILQEIIFSLF